MLHTEATAKTHLVAMLELREAGEPGLLLCYNSKSQFFYFILIVSIRTNSCSLQYEYVKILKKTYY